MSATRSTAAIILAAGTSSRMGGRHKLLLPLHNRPVLAHVIDATLASQARPILVVLGHQADQVKAQFATYTTHPDITFIENSNYLQGMSTSMKVGLESMVHHDYEKRDDSLYVDSALIILGDQPLITPQIIDTLITTWQTTDKRIVAPLYEGMRGNPILFADSLFGELLEVTGDEGGRRVVERHKGDLVTVELGSAVASYDVDTWEAYQQVVEVWQERG